MIGRLTGRVVAHEVDGAFLLDVSGVGYELQAPIGTLGRLRADEQGRVTLWVHTHVREDTLALFGFSDEAERAAFRLLLGVSNVGPKIAVAVLGALPVAELARAVAQRDLPALTAVPGIGRKIAERLLLELRDKIPVVHGAAGATTAAGARTARDGAAGPERRGAADRLRGALTGIGFKPGEADRAIAALEERGDRVLEEAPFEETLREALAVLAR